MTTHRRLDLPAPLHLGAATLALAAGLCGAPAAGQPDAEDAVRVEAVRLFEQGLAAFQAADFPAARDAFRASYQLRPNAAVLFNLANTERALYDYPESMRSFRAYLERFGDRATAEERTEIEAWLADMEWRVAYVTVEAPAGASVLLDDRLVGTAPLAEPLVLTAESHVVAAVFEGGVPEREVLAPTRGARLTVRLAPAPPESAPPEEPPPQEPPPPPVEDPLPPVDGPPAAPRTAESAVWGRVPLALGTGANLRTLDFENRGFTDNLFWSVGVGFQFTDWLGASFELVLPSADLGFWARFAFLRLSWLRLSGAPGLVVTTGALSDRGAGAAVAAGLLAEFRLWEGLTLWLFPTVGLDTVRTVFVAPLSLGVGYWL